MPVAKPRNLVGPRVQKLRMDADLTQHQLAARCALLGWNMSREMVAKIERRERWLADFELVVLANVLEVTVAELYPNRALSETKVLMLNMGHGGFSKF